MKIKILAKCSTKEMEQDLQYGMKFIYTKFEQFKDNCLYVICTHYAGIKSKLIGRKQQ